MKFSIKVKSSVFLATLLILTVSILSILVLKGIKDNQQKEQEEYLVHQTKIANTYVKQMYLTDSIKDEGEFLQKNAQELVRQVNSINGMHAVIYDMRGKEVVNSMAFSDITNMKEILSYALSGKIAYEVRGNTLVYMAPLYHESQIGVIKFEYSIENDINFYNEIKSLFISTGCVVFILSFITGYFYFHRYVRVILKLKKDALNIRRGFYNDIILCKRNDELGELSEGIYYMSNQIEKNIKEIKEEHQKFKLTLEKVKKLEKQQRVFIGNITHEFKTPLTVIKAYSDLLEMYSDDPNLLKDAKDNIAKETQRLYEMVEKVLYLSSLEKYDFELQTENLNMKEVLEEICSRMKGKAQKFNVSMITNIQSATILGDKESLVHIFTNLIDNGIKYNELNGRLCIKSYIKDKYVFIEVSDTGIGIPKEAKERIFEPFYTVNKDRSKKYGGIGLGLSIVKELIEKQNGVISLQDNEAKGTTFLISFPLV
ncbi:HAMP domain-containing sensor histidine kinase [Bacillus mycoides]|uniref:HAMP domain-containing sensor histidine kinase n=1 Tax=Bacillus cereus group TaxID=86661 RepID=UPI0007B1C77F|nr:MULTISPECIES: HAMP domain-containing sensor histidine kinase [Bacillus cereus group]KAA0768072.1 sensor histidine kinase [Bacillus sp. BB51/4]KZE06692.1 integral membrane sensor signal transduction histidine kinase [Bacillus mycoides]